MMATWGDKLGPMRTFTSLCFFHSSFRSRGIADEGGVKAWRSAEEGPLGPAARPAAAVRLDPTREGEGVLGPKSRAVAATAAAVAAAAAVVECGLAADSRRVG